MLNINKAWEMYNNVMLGRWDAVALLSPLEQALRELTAARRALESGGIDMSGAFSCNNDSCGGLKLGGHPRGLCRSCDQKEKNTYLLDTIKQALELVDAAQWPGLYANLETQKKLLTGELVYVSDETISSLRRLGLMTWFK